MITAIIIFASLLLAAAYFVAWLKSPDLRREIEEPKHCFQDQIRQYDHRCREAADNNGAESR